MRTSAMLVLALGLGFAAGVLFQRAVDRSGPEPTPRPENGRQEAASGGAAPDPITPASEPAPVAPSSDPPGPGPSPVQPAAGSALEDLRARVPALTTRQDGPGLIKLMRDLAALGEEGYPAALEILDLLLKAQDETGKIMGMSGQYFLVRTASADIAALMAWALKNPSVASAELRSQLGNRITWQDAIDPGTVLLAALEVETDPRLRRVYASQLENCMTEEIAARVRALATNSPELAEQVVDALRQSHLPGSRKSLEALILESPDPAVREDARRSLEAMQSQERGIFVRRTYGSGSPLRRGDIIVSANGSKIDSRFALWTLLRNVGSEELVSMSVIRDGELVTIQLAQKLAMDAGNEMVGPPKTR